MSLIFLTHNGPQGTEHTSNWAKIKCIDVKSTKTESIFRERTRSPAASNHMTKNLYKMGAPFRSFMASIFSALLVSALVCLAAACPGGYKKASDDSHLSCKVDKDAEECAYFKGKCSDDDCCMKDDKQPPPEPKKDDANPCPAGKNPYREAGKSSCMPDANGKTECADKGQGTCDNDKKATGPKAGECCSCCSFDYGQACA
ncbi:hypothetical protein Ddc_18193 [Ditylenchus destructor]|nr:hypothetical protein Ddc_18193 [Ditylenchus destructor]